MAGVAAQYESEVVYHKINEELERQGVIFLDTDTALKEHPDLFGSISALSSRWATTSSRRSTPRFGQVARSSTCRRVSMSRSRCRPISGSTPRTWASSSTLIIVDEGAYVHYVEGAPHPSSSDSLHSAVVEIIVKKDARRRYDDPELVEQRLQPGDQARHLRGGRDHGMD